MDRLPVTGLVSLLEGLLTNALGDRYGKLTLSPLSQENELRDANAVLLLRDSAGEPRAVAICSAPASPGMVARAMHRARQAKDILGPAAGAPILDPLAEGTVLGLSYAVLPYCGTLSRSRAVWWVQRALLRRTVLDWIMRAAESTLRDVDPALVSARFAEPLRRLASLNLIGERVRTAAQRAVARLADGAWTPRHVLMHGDLWKDNILIRPASDLLDKGRWHQRFVLIDWAGSEVHGYAIYDLVRFAQSMSMSAENLMGEVYRHCRLLRCEPNDAMSYLVAGLSYIFLNLEYFPVHQFVEMTESCYLTLARAMEAGRE